MNAGIEICVDEKLLSNISGELNHVYRRLSSVKTNLEEIHKSISNVWKDEAADDFSAKYDQGMEAIWDMLVAIDSMETFLINASTGYKTADEQVMSLK